MRNAIEFVLNGERRKLSAFDPTLTVMRYLREQERLTGTKEGCAEGDCGACTTVVVTLEDETLRYSAVNSCIQFIGMLDGKALLTVEYLKSADGLHPIQDALTREHATQCGFCTPGFAMSLFAGERGGCGKGRADIDELLAGNLCRCTGYNPIIKAAKSLLGGLAAPCKFTAREKVLVEQLRKLKKGAVHVESEGRTFTAPATTGELAKLLRRKPTATLVAGGTDVGLFVTKQHRVLENVIDLGKIAVLRRVVCNKKGLRLGATVTYVCARRNLVALYPELDELLRRLGSTQVRNQGTIGGNIANGSPIGDMPPALIATNASLRLRRGDVTREIALEDYFLIYGKQDRRQGEFIESIFVPTPNPRGVFKVYKISKRFDQDISSVCGAFNVVFDAKLRKVEDVRICFGGMAGTPVRAEACERFLLGKQWTEGNIADAADILEREFEPLTDWRASAAYRRKVAGNLLRRYFLETAEGRSLRLSASREAAYV